MKTFLIIFSAVLLAILAAAGILHFIRNSGRPDKSQPQISTEEAAARKRMKGLTPGEVITVCGKPQSDYVGDYGDSKWRILAYNQYEANFILKENQWQYDFSSDGGGHILPDATIATAKGIQLPCDEHPFTTR